MRARDLGGVAPVAARRRGAFRPLRGVWIAQVALACGLVFAADSLGLRNPMGYVVAIVLAVSVGGAGLFGVWRVVRLAVRRRRVG